MKQGKVSSKSSAKENLPGASPGQGKGNAKPKTAGKGKAADTDAAEVAAFLTKLKGSDWSAENDELEPSEQDVEQEIKALVNNLETNGSSEALTLVSVARGTSILAVDQ